MIYAYEDIRAVHIEVTDRCNAACPMCPRYDQKTGAEAPWVRRTQLYLDDIQTILPPDFVRQLNRINFCGNYGDPMVARDLIPIIRYFKEHQPRIRIEVNTNGSGRTVEWWRELAGLLGGHERYGGVWFGLDGLEDTNHIYRRNTNWDIIMRNAQAYIGAGGAAYWNFLAFGHNEHQIDEAREFAYRMGFRHFNVKLTGRFNTNPSFPVVVKGEHLYDLKGTKAEELSRPVVPPKPANDRAKRHEAIIADLKERGILDGKVVPVEIAPPVIECVVAKEKSIYLSATGHVFPCCWIGDAHNHDIQVKYLSADNLDARKRSLKDIIEGDEFGVIEKSWETGSIHKCVRFCGVNETDDKHKYGPDYVIRDPRRGPPRETPDVES